MSDMTMNYPRFGNVKSHIDNCLIQSCSKKRILFELINSLADDLLVQILMRLPSKCAYVCKAVCKRWKSLISTGYFITLFINHHKETHLSKDSIYNFTLLFQYFVPRSTCHTRSLFFNPDLSKCRTVSLSFNPVSSRYLIRHVDLDFLPEGFCVMATCHDLMLYSLCDVYYVVNWYTRQRTELPCPPSISPVFQQKDGNEWGLLSYRDLNEHAFRFKVILFAPPQKRGSRAFNVRIFCSKSRQWSKVNVKWYKWSPYSSVLSSNIIAHNDKLHWVDVCSLFSLDLFNGDPHLKLHRIRLPIGFYWNNPYVVGLCCGCIRFAFYQSVQGDPYLEVWELTDCYKGVWKLVSQTDVSILFSLTSVLFGFTLVGFNPDNGDDIFMYLENYIYIFNIKTKVLHRFQEVQIGHQSMKLRIRSPVSQFFLLPQWFPTEVSSPVRSNPSNHPTVKT